MAFSPSEFKPFILEKVEHINHNVSLFRFKLPNESDVANLPVTSCVLFRSVQQDKEVVRPYTSVSTKNEKGYVDFVIKDYPQGNMSHHVHSLKVGESIDIKGPFVKWDWEKKPVKHVGMIAGGTGITPMLQVLRKVFDKDSKDDSKITLVYANTTYQDILFKNELDHYAKTYPDRFQVYYVLEKLNESEKQSNIIKGYVSSNLLKQVMPQPNIEDSIIFVCGPPGMMQAISGDKAQDKSQGTLQGFLKDLGYVQPRVYKL